MKKKIKSKAVASDGAPNRMVRIPADLSSIVDKHRNRFNDEHGVAISFNGAIIQLVRYAIASQT